MKFQQTQSIYRHFVLFVLLLLSICVFGGTDFDVSYEICSAGEGKPGYYLVEINAYVPKRKYVSKDITKQCAVHGVLFKGYAGKQGYASKPAIITNEKLEKEYSEYFDSLIEEKFDYYTSMANEFMKVVKIGKQYKITTIVMVNAAQLRKDLERDNIIRSLGF